MTTKNTPALSTKNVTMYKYNATSKKKAMYALPFLTILGILPSEVEAGGFFSRLSCCFGDDAIATRAATTAPRVPTSTLPLTLTPTFSEAPMKPAKRMTIAEKVRLLEENVAITAILAEATKQKYRDKAAKMDGYIKIFVRAGIKRLSLPQEEQDALLALVNEGATGEVFEKHLHSQEVVVKKFVNAAILRLPTEEQVALKTLAEGYFSRMVPDFS